VKILSSILIAIALLLLARRAAGADEEGLLSPYGFALTVGAGVTGFVDQDMRDAADPGGTWEARLSAGTRLPVTFEAAYVGSAQDINLSGMEASALLVGTGLEGVLRLNILRGEWNPYFLIGAGWTRYEVNNTDSNTSIMNNHDDVVALPFGVGLDNRLGRHWIVDARAVMRPTFDNELLPDSPEPGNPTHLDSWSLLLRGGYEF
jgi:hypothetical protein